MAPRTSTVGRRRRERRNGGSGHSLLQDLGDLSVGCVYGALALAIHRVEIGATSDEYLHHRGTSLLYRKVEGRVAILALKVHQRPVLKQHLSQISVALHRHAMERCPAVLVGDIHVNVALHQRTDDLVVEVIARNVKRRPAILILKLTSALRVRM